VATRTSLRSVVRLAALAAVVAAIAPSAANAGLLDGVLSTEDAAACDPNASQVFKNWGDNAYYTLVEGGSFEGTNSWTLKNGAKVVSGNEPFYVRSTSDTRSLALPEGSSALTPTVCFEFADWHGRLFARKTSKDSGYIKVEVVVRSLVGGVLAVVDGGTLKPNGEWQPSERVGLLTCNITSLVGTDAVAFRFKSVGASFRIDDFYLDPWKSS
jgi:hypothetical protein